MELVSIIVPIYNCEITIKRCLDSLLNQTYENLEIILVNNGSRDKSGLIAKECAQSNFKVMYLQCDKLTKGNTCAYGLNEAHGEYVCFIDGKDYVDHDYISKMMEAFGDADYVEAKHVLINEHNSIKEITNHTRDDINDYNLKENPAYLADVCLNVMGNLYRRQLLNELEYHGDLDFSVMLLLRVSHLQYVSNTKYYVYERDDNPFMYHANEAFACMKRLHTYLRSHELMHYSWLLEKVFICDFLKQMCMHHAINEKEKKERLLVLKEALGYLDEELSGYKKNVVLTKKEKAFINNLHNPLLKGFMLK